MKSRVYHYHVIYVEEIKPGTAQKAGRFQIPEDLFGRCLQHCTYAEGDNFSDIIF